MMNQSAATHLITQTFETPFETERFAYFARNLLNTLNESSATSWRGAYIADSFKGQVRQYHRLGTYIDPSDQQLDVLVIELIRARALDQARAMQRNFVAHHLKQRDNKEAALVATFHPERPDWRFSLVKMDYHAFYDETTERLKIQESLTPARRYSFLVGQNEPNHTAQQQLVPLLADTQRNPSLETLESAFNIEAVTKEFFQRYKDLFLDLKESLDHLAKQEAQVQAEFQRVSIDTATFAKKLLGQIVFLYFLQKKGWLGVAEGADWGQGSKDFLRCLFDGQPLSGGFAMQYANFFNDVLEPLFYEALALQRPHDLYPRLNSKVPFLNGGLFEPSKGYDWQGVDILLPNEQFQAIFETFDLYNFTVREDEPLEKEVAVDPEMLGKVFENLLEVQDRKSKGAFYTPREIVHYMCQESLINYLDTALNTHFGDAIPEQLGLTTATPRQTIPRADLVNFIRQGELSLEYDTAKARGTKSYTYRLPEAIRTHAAALDKALTEIKICDPAIGSGAFPVGLMQEVVRARTVLTPHLQNNHPESNGDQESNGFSHCNDQQLKPLDSRLKPLDSEGSNTRTPYALKRHTIQESIYGVDIDPAAVDIAKLRLWLSLVVDEEDYRQIQPLPNLDYKIVCGNALLGYPYEPRGLKEVEAWKQTYFDETDMDQKTLLRQNIDAQIKQLYRNTQKSLGYQVDFDFQINFSEVFRQRGGFDVVIGNPPYVRQELIKDQKRALKAVHPNIYVGTADLYVYFYAQAMEILSQRGCLSYITGNKFMRAGYGKKLRQFLGRQTTLKTLIDFGDLPVFEATAYPCILITQKAPPSSDNAVAALTVTETAQIKQITPVIATQAWPMPVAQALTDDGWRLERPEVLHLLGKLRQAGTPLGEYVEGRLYYGIKTGYNEAFVIDRTTRDRLIAEHSSSAEIIKPFLRGRDVKRWTVNFAEKYLIKLESSQNVQHPWSNLPDAEAESVFAETYPAIHAHFQQYRQALIKRYDQGAFFWELRACAYWNEFEKPKIIYPDIAKKTEFAYDIDNYFLGDTLYLLPTLNVWLVGLLNSKLIFWLYNMTSSQIRGGFVRFKSQYVSQIPIPTPPTPNPIEALVSQILEAKKANPAAEVDVLEAEIDRLVYALYGLTEAEIALVAGTGVGD